MISKPITILEKEYVTNGIPHKVIIERMVPMRTGVDNKQDFNNYMRLVQDQGLTFNPELLDIDCEIWRFVGPKYKLYQARWVDNNGNDFVFHYFVTDVRLLGGVDVDGSVLYSMRYWFDYGRSHKSRHAVRMGVMVNSKNELVQTIVMELEDNILEIARDIGTYKYTKYVGFSVSTRELVPREKTDRALVMPDYMVNLPPPVPEYCVH